MYLGFRVYKAVVAVCSLHMLLTVTAASSHAKVVPKHHVRTVSNTGLIHTTAVKAMQVYSLQGQAHQCTSVPVSNALEHKQKERQQTCHALGENVSSGSHVAVLQFKLVLLHIMICKACL